MYPDLAIQDRLFMVVKEFARKAYQSGDHTYLASYAELAKVFDGLYINPKTGRPALEAINWIRTLVSRIRKDKGHPHIRPYTEPHIEVDVEGNEVVRNYVNILMGSQAVKAKNLVLEKQKTGISEAQDDNKEVVNVKKVMKEVDEYSEYLEQRQREANDKRRKNKERKE